MNWFPYVAKILGLACMLFSFFHAMFWDYKRSLAFTFLYIALAMSDVNINTNAKVIIEKED